MLPVIDVEKLIRIY